ncbi:hypothetical protein KAR10_01070 [bacterium]|nr:hypothetical protein [bacterium]
MIQTGTSQLSPELIHQWWLNCSSAVCTLPQEHTHEWIALINEAVRNYRLFIQSTHSNDQRYYRNLCRESMAKTRWELMLISMYGFIPQEEIRALEELQTSIEQSL